MKSLFTVCLLAVMVITFNGCKKNHDDKKRNCRIITATPIPGGDGYIFTYGADGKLSSASLGPSFIQYANTGTTKIVTTTTSGQFVSKVIIINNAAGLALNVRTEFNPAGTNWTNTVYEYTGEELKKSTTTDSSGTTSSVTDYVWVNHNMVTGGTAGSTPTTFDYFLDKPHQQGDFFFLLQTLQGYEIYRPKNLLKEFGGSTFTYDFNADGNISLLGVISGGNTTFLQYQYQCD
ncbi:MAG: hypothetical protein ABI480_16545 [Chitinophagaceae bacterium]